MKIKLLVIFLLPFIFGFMNTTTPDWSDDPTAAFQSSLLEARHLADKKDRPYMIIFQADWCSPCQWMDKFTYGDPRVQQFLLDNYSAVKMDIDEFEGFALKEQYQVKLLPTLLFFDRNNEIIGRYENTYDVHDFLKILETHKNFGKQQMVMQRSSSSPATTSVNKTSSPLRRPVSQTTTSTSDTHSSVTTSSPMRRPVQNSTTSRPVATASKPSTGEFTVQIGAFNSHQNAENMIMKMRAKLAPGQSIRVRQLDHIKYPYRVTIGEYYSHEEASAALMTLDNNGVKGLLKRTDQFR